MARKISRLARKVFSGRKYSGVVTEREYATILPCNGRVTFYTIQTGKEGEIVRGSIRGDSYNFDRSMNVGDRVEVTLGRPYTAVPTRRNVKEKARDGSTTIVSKKIEWPRITSYKILEKRLDEDGRGDKNARGK